MRLASQFIQSIIHTNTNVLDRLSKSLFEHARGKHHATKKLEEALPGKKSECIEPCKGHRKSIWSIFGSSKKRSEHSEKKGESETAETVSEEQAERDIQNITEMSKGKVFRTCGSAYLLQKDHVEHQESPPKSSEDEILEEMMKDPTLKGQCDPMPPFQSVELKMIELSERKLHPLYKKLMSIPKKPKLQLSKSSGGQIYKTRSGPIMPDEFPAHLKINKELLEKKNIPFEFKKAHPPQQMLAQMVEMRNNERPKLTYNPQAKDRSKK